MSCGPRKGAGPTRPAGPGAASASGGSNEKRPRARSLPAVPSPAALTTSALFFGGIMKVYLSIAVGLLLLSACLFLLLRPGDEGGPLKKTPGPKAVVLSPSGPPIEKPAPAHPLTEPVAAPAPAVEKKEAPLAALPGRVLDELGTP